jgi:hypothetical protein
MMSPKVGLSWFLKITHAHWQLFGSYNGHNQRLLFPTQLSYCKTILTCYSIALNSAFFGCLYRLENLPVIKFTWLIRSSFYAQTLTISK